jgi:hypothetical protein
MLENPMYLADPPEVVEMETWQFIANDSILNGQFGPVLVGARKNSRGPWLNGGQLPQHVQWFLNLQLHGGRWHFFDYVGLSTADMRTLTTVKWQRSDPRGIKGTFEIQAPDKPRVTKIPANVPAIRSLRDLCEHFGADIPALLNKRIYKGTDCGASISVHLTQEAYVSLGPIEVWPSFKCCGREWQGKPWMRTNADRAKVQKQEAAGIARHKCPTCGKTHKTERISKPLVVDPYKGAWIHNGDDLWARLMPDTPILGFTIQTIVEGSDATVDSDEFVLPVTVASVEAWVREMESEATALWQEANGDEAEA